MLASSACTPLVVLDADFSYANARTQNQTAPDTVMVFGGDVEQPYDVLADLEVIVRQSSAFGEPPSKDAATRALREQAGRIGAHALVFVEFGQMGVSWWSWNELRGHGRAIRFR
jgi:hypothetical protein